MPAISTSSIYGAAFEVPYYWALAPDYDATFAPMITTKQGPLLEGEFRQRLINGAYSIRAAGIHQLDKEYFIRSDGSTTPGYRDFRGSVESSGMFALNNKWVWGWDAHPALRPHLPAGLQPASVALSYLRPVPKSGERSASRSSISPAKAIAAISTRAPFIISASRKPTCKAQIPVIHPVIDYNYIFDHPILGGELGYKINFTSLTRNEANFDPITQSALNDGTCTQTANPAVKTSASCLLRGVPGTYSRFSAERSWRRSITDSVRPGLHAIRDGPRRCRFHANQERSRRCQLHGHRRQQPGPRHADDWFGIPLSLHQRAILGHTNNRADCADHRAAQ